GSGGGSDVRGRARPAPRLVPAIFDDASWTIATPGDITIQSDLVVRHFDAAEGALGLFSSGGDVNIGASAPNDVHIDAFIVAAGTDGEFRVVNYDSGSPRGTVYLRGGCVEQYYGGFSTFNSATGAIQTGYARDFRYDHRGMVPPSWPLAVPPVVAVPPARAADGLSLAPPVPNPAHGTLRIRYTLPRATRVRIELFDTAGRRIARVVDADQSA